MDTVTRLEDKRRRNDLVFVYDVCVGRCEARCSKQTNVDDTPKYDSPLYACDFLNYNTL